MGTLVVEVPVIIMFGLDSDGVSELLVRVKISFYKRIKIILYPLASSNFQIQMTASLKTFLWLLLMVG